MNADISSVLADINANVNPALTQPTPDMIRAKAILMAKRGYRFDEQSYSLVGDLVARRGLLLSGGVGWGKSFFFYCASVPALNLKIAQSKHLADICKALDSHRNSPILIDDVGIEERDYKDYGTSVNLLDIIIEKRTESPLPTHFTTNLTVEEMCRRYSDRTIDRIRGMARICEVTGESKRDPDAPKRNEAWFDDFYRPPLWSLCAKCCSFYDEDERRCTKGKVIEPRPFQRQGYDPVPACPYC